MLKKNRENINEGGKKGNCTDVIIIIIIRLKGTLIPFVLIVINIIQ